MRFKCTTCGTEHEVDKISFGADAPLQWNALSEAERSRSMLGEEQCEIQSKEGHSFYIHACIEIPIIGRSEAFAFGVWCSLSKQSYSEICEHWNDSERTKFGPYFGWLCTRIPGYPDTALLKTNIHQRNVGVRPFIKLEPTNHALAVDQRNGISEERWKYIVTVLLHGPLGQNRISNK